ncbi:MAG: helix-turn-helix transcriptional regulator [Thermomicrobiales bacterium]|nr:helix-turn-helix transcriptional regulator [Thermomicrobiales bacterium]
MDERVYAEVKRLCYSGLDGVALVRESVRRLCRVMPFEAYCALTMDPLSGLISQARAEGMGGEREAHVFLERVYFEDYPNAYSALALTRRSTLLLSEATGGRLDRSLRYRELLAPLGHGHELRGVFTVGRELWGATELTRERGRPDFDRREIALLQRVSPHLGAGLKAAALNSHPVPDDGSHDDCGVLVLDHRGRVLRFTGAAERWLAELEDPDSGWGEGRGPAAWREGRGLPAAVCNARGSLVRALKPETERDRESVPRVRVLARSGRWLTLQAMLSEPRVDGESETVIVIEPSVPREVAWLRAAGYGLTARERQIVDLVVRGISTRQIAQTLFVSEQTVQKHLSNIFAKVGVRSRSALVKRLFFDNISLSLFG